jgi:hypothetical protein
MRMDAACTLTLGNVKQCRTTCKFRTGLSLQNAFRGCTSQPRSLAFRRFTRKLNFCSCLHKSPTCPHNELVPVYILVYYFYPTSFNFIRPSEHGSPNFYFHFCASEDLGKESSTITIVDEFY